MGTTKRSQKVAKSELDSKLKLSHPSREVLEELAVVCAKDPTPDNTFQYAFCMSKSTERSELRYALSILDGLIDEGYEHQFDCMYGAATALYLLEDYAGARARCEAMLRTRPESRIASELHLASIASIEQRDAKRAKHIALGSTAAFAAVGLAAGVASVLLSKR